MAGYNLRIKKTATNFFKRISATIPLNISLFTIFKAFSIYSLSFLFISSQKYIKLNNIKIYRVVFRVFTLQKSIIL